MIQTLVKTTTKEDFVKFLTDDRDYIEYDDKVFTKEVKDKLLKIKVEDQLVYEVHLEKNILIVTNALYCTFNRDEYWDIAKMLEIEEVIADRQSLIRI
ncbi:MAG: hypothetical protein ACRC1P_10630 [Cellulosilyticaceae bacterium]